jgi:lysophospholipid acyltransferase (LPLAT)-like uncharacterized protein
MEDKPALQAWSPLPPGEACPEPSRRGRGEGKPNATTPSPTLPRSQKENEKSARSRWRRPLLRVLTAVAPVLISGALRLLRKTVRITFVNEEELFGRWERGEQVIVAFWHNRAVMMPVAYRGAKLCTMNSQHRDGEIATRALARWGIRSVRGSATRGGASGFMQLVNAYRTGYDLAVVPDGPRGPRYVVKRGVVQLARATGAPIFPVTYAASRKRRLRSWDRLIIPLPFARVLFIVGQPLRVPRDADAETLEAKRVELEDRLNGITTAVEALVAGDGSFPA